ncbi:MAG: hypothetical protein HQL72_02685 [Magnetococcales bacterium]|nr:hypothetical protein [Magnetococcales bacterium]
MASIAKLVAMESILEQMAGELVLEVQEGRTRMDEELMQCMESLVVAARKTQVFREKREASEMHDLQQETTEEYQQRMRMAC